MNTRDFSGIYDEHKDCSVRTPAVDRQHIELPAFNPAVSSCTFQAAGLQLSSAQFLSDII